jgi:CheY-like chemotaxis protein
MRILLVDDDPILALLAEIALEGDGHQIIGPAYDADEALRLAEANAIDLAFVDINLSGHDEGVDLAQLLYERFNLFSLFVSGQVDVAKANTRYAVGLLAKPYTPHDLSRSAHIVHALVKGELPLTLSVPSPLTLFTDSTGLYATLDGSTLPGRTQHDRIRAR